MSYTQPPQSMRALMSRFSLAVLAGLVLACIAGAAAVSAQTTALTEYDCWGNLSFPATRAGVDYWSANGTAVTYVADPTSGHLGGGPKVLRIDGSSAISVWGTHSSGTVFPAVGDVVGGSFWIYLLAAPAAGAAVDVRMTGYDATNAATIFCHTAAVDLTALPVTTWVKLALAPTSSTWAAGLDLQFNIVSSGGVNCYLNAVSFGKLTTTPGAGGSVSAGILPVIQGYAGSTFNGNFEVGNAAVGNQYWGQSVTGMMNLITNPSGTAPGAPVNGKNMVSIARGGIAWNIANVAASATDSLPRAGEMVAGSYWLYVPLDADLSTGFPTVSFVSRLSGDLVIADSIPFPAASIQKGAWNQIPIYPVAPNRKVELNAASVAILVTALPLNSAYASPYFIDDIKVGAVPAGLLFSPSTSLTDATGNRIEQLGASDTALFAKVAIQNSQNTTATSGFAVLSLYQNGVLAKTVSNPVTIAATGSTGVSYTQTSFTVPLDGINQATLSATVKLLASDQTTTLAAPRSLIRLSRTIAPNDPNLRYVGRWTGSAASALSDYVRPYFKTAFTGTSVAIKLKRSVDLDVTIDGSSTHYSGANGLVELASNLSGSGAHTLSVVGGTFPDLIELEALYLDASGALVATVMAPNHIEFIGDSITAWNNGYSWLVPAAMGVESSRICWPGIALQTGFGYVTTTPANVGMKDAYFNIAMPSYGSGTAGLWDFQKSPYAPNLIVINLGTNDAAQITAVPGFLANFQTAYVEFIRALRVKHPNAEIFVMRPVSIPYANVNTAIANAAQTVMAGDAKVHFIDTTNWTVQIDPADQIHPTNYGHTQIVAYLQPILAPYVKSAAPAWVSASTAACLVGDAFRFNVMATGAPAPTFSASGLPAWLSLNAATGVLQGIPPQAGVYQLALAATNATSAAPQSFSLTVTGNLTGYNQWKGLFNWAQPGTDDAPAADPNADGITNLMAYAADLPPVGAGSRSPMVAGNVAPDGTFHFEFRRAAGGALGVVYTVHAGPSPATLAPVDFSAGSGNRWLVLSDDPDGDGSAEMIRVEIATGGSPTYFGTLRVNRAD